MTKVPKRKVSRKREYYAGVKFFIDNFGVVAKTLKNRGVNSRRSNLGMEYDIQHFVKTCPDLIIAKLSKLEEQGIQNSSIGALKTEKMREDVRKIKLQNDYEEGKLVKAEDVKSAYARGMRSVCDVLDAIPSRVKMNAPDIPPSALATIQDTLIEVRNNASTLTFNGQEMEITEEDLIEDEADLL